MNNAVTREEFAAAMHQLGCDAARPLGIAVSGGGDSMALAVLAQQWGAAVAAFTVDHGLRAGSDSEARRVHDMLASRGIAHDILTWRGDKPSAGVQAKARDARYDLLLAACRARGIATLAVAHNLEDQAETFWMRLAHGSGLDGLAAMALVRDMGGVSLARPLLGFSRDRLRATCVAHGIEWIEDPSNRNDKFLRVRLRGFEDALAAEGLTPARLAATVQKLQDAQEALAVMASRAAALCLTVYEEGYALIDLAVWRAEPKDIQRRLLAQAMGAVAPSLYPPGFEAVEELRQSLQGAGFAGRTLAGCEIFASGGHLFVSREAAAAETRRPVTEGLLWDGRFVVMGAPAESCDVGALGEVGIVELRKSDDAAHQLLDRLPAKVRRVLPALWRGENLVAVPHVSYCGDAALQNCRLRFVNVV